MHKNSLCIICFICRSQANDLFSISLYKATHLNIPLYHFISCLTPPNTHHPLPTPHKVYRVQLTRLQLTALLQLIHVKCKHRCTEHNIQPHCNSDYSEIYLNYLPASISSTKLSSLSCTSHCGHQYFHFHSRAQLQKVGQGELAIHSLEFHSNIWMELFVHVRGCS